MQVFSFIYFLLFCAIAQASSFTDLGFFTSNGTERLEVKSAFNPLRFTNRAQCAMDSELPSPSIFVLLDSSNAEHLAFNKFQLMSFAEKAGLTEDSFVNDTSKAFRLTVVHFLNKTINGLLLGKLPLLELEKEYSNEKLAQIITSAAVAPYSANTKRLWQNTIGFQKSNFFQGEYQRSSCHLLKRFSSLHGHLQMQTPDSELIKQLANFETSIAHCLDQSSRVTNPHTVLQFDISGLTKDWDKVGFKFWKSVKTYFSWQWYHHISNPYAELTTVNLRETNIESALIFVPNGCKSIEPPRCDSSYLSVNSLRELFVGTHFDLQNLYRMGPHAKLANKELPSVNRDELNTAKAESANEWLKLFRDRLVGYQTWHFDRFTTANTFLQMLFSELSQQKLIDSLYQAKEQVLEWSRTDEINNQLAWKNIFYALCNEFDLAATPKLGMLNEDFSALEQVTSLQSLPGFSSQKLLESVEALKQISKEVDTICSELSEAKLWRQPFQYNRLAQHRWYLEAIDPEEQMGASEPNKATGHEKPEVFFGEALLELNLRVDQDSTKTICYDGVDCARRYLAAMVDIVSVLHYAKAILPLKGDFLSPAAFNRFSDLNACQVYDPWFQQRRANKALLANVANTALFGWNFVPFQFAYDSEPDVVEYFDIKSEGDQIVYKPKIREGRSLISGHIDFTSLLGIPCSISLSNQGDMPIASYDLSSKYLNPSHQPFVYLEREQCSTDATNAARVKNQKGDTNRDMSARTYCYRCSLSISSLSNLNEEYITPPMGVFNPFRLFASVMRTMFQYQSMTTNSPNMPKKMELDINQILRNRSKLEDRECLENLQAGGGCEWNSCKEKLRSYVEQFTGDSVKSVQVYEDFDPEDRAGKDIVFGQVYTQLCRQGYSLRFRVDNNKSCEDAAIDDVVMETRKEELQCE